MKARRAGMQMTDEVGLGHNNPPETLAPPTPESISEDLAKRYPEVAKRLKELQGAAAKVPATIKTEGVAKDVQDLLKQCAVAKKTWAATRGVEKEPWQTAADTVFEFFKSPEETVAGLIADLKPRHTDFLARKAAAEKAEREAKAKAEREAAEKKVREAAEAEARRVAAEKEAADAREREAEAIRREDEAKQDRMWHEARAELAQWEENKALERRKARQAQEKIERQADKRRLTELTREAKVLGKKDDAGILSDDDRDRYRQLIGDNGEIPMLQKRLQDAEDGVLSPEEVEQLRAEEQDLAALRAERRVNHEKAEAAKRAARAAADDQSEARADIREAKSDVQVADRQASLSLQDAERLEGRADRMDRQLNKATDADLSRTRGNRGTVGSLTGRWEPEVVDRDAIPLDRLRGYLHPDAIDAAITLYARDNRTEQGIPPLPGVKFHWVKDSRIV